MYLDRIAKKYVARLIIVLPNKIRNKRKWAVKGFFFLFKNKTKSDI